MVFGGFGLQVWLVHVGCFLNCGPFFWVPSVVRHSYKKRDPQRDPRFEELPMLGFGV